MIEAMTACPACGGSGGGPFGRAGSAWDDETYECTRCRGTGVLGVAPVAASARPLAKGAARRPEPAVERVVEKRGPVSTRPAAAAKPGDKDATAKGR
jgi:hypothetical protein